ncbi:hypothetical protein HU762_08160 [Pseudomonas sp. SWRI92]|uniref:Uncharacterized protein n=1 Tax=Pseudomonas marvdashtae TaxID=2745500 RepID=A0A923FT98_9PSED|nr:MULTISPECIES: hypothetical protein [Pseudomonas]MBC3373916.1 hypothetical protein [Pseudomonas sp. SWRI92]MBV4554160.1 hypothetical protein [Pseudomonas marvdashtae]
MSFFNGHLHANMELDGSTYEFRVDGELEYRDAGSCYLLSAHDENGRGLSIWLPRSMPEGQQEYDLGEPGYPEVHFMLRRSLSPLRSGVLSVTVGGDVQCAGTFGGVDERGRTFSGGSFRLEKY